MSNERFDEIFIERGNLMTVDHCKNTIDKVIVHDPEGGLRAGKRRRIGDHKGSLDLFMFVPFGFHIINLSFLRVYYRNVRTY